MFARFALPSLCATRPELRESEPRKFALIHSGGGLRRGGIHSRAISLSLSLSLTVFERGRNWRQRRRIGPTGRTAFPLRQMEKETRLMEESGKRGIKWASSIQPLPFSLSPSSSLLFSPSSCVNKLSRNPSPDIRRGISGMATDLSRAASLYRNYLISSRMRQSFRHFGVEINSPASEHV